MRIVNQYEFLRKKITSSGSTLYGRRVDADDDKVLMVAAYYMGLSDALRIEPPCPLGVDEEREAGR